MDADSQFPPTTVTSTNSPANPMTADPPILTVGIVQPWAWGLIYGPQRELLLRVPAQRLGTHLIFTSKTRQFLTPAACRHFPNLPSANELTFGAFIGTADVTECIRVRSDWRWTFANPRPIEPIRLENGTLRYRLAQKAWKRLRYLD